MLIVRERGVRAAEAPGWHCARTGIPLKSRRCWEEDHHPAHTKGSNRRQTRDMTPFPKEASSKMCGEAQGSLVPKAQTQPGRRQGVRRGRREVGMSRDVPSCGSHSCGDLSQAGIELGELEMRRLSRAERGPVIVADCGSYVGGATSSLTSTAAQVFPGGFVQPPRHWPVGQAKVALRQQQRNEGGRQMAG